MLFSINFNKEYKEKTKIIIDLDQNKDICSLF
jgi:hypothetical protein